MAQKPDRDGGIGGSNEQSPEPLGGIACAADHPGLAGTRRCGPDELVGGQFATIPDLGRCRGFQQRVTHLRGACHT